MLCYFFILWVALFGMEWNMHNRRKNFIPYLYTYRIYIYILYLIVHILTWYSLFSLYTRYAIMYTRACHFSKYFFSIMFPHAKSTTFYKIQCSWISYLYRIDIMFWMHGVDLSIKLWWKGYKSIHTHKISFVNCTDWESV